MPQLNVATHILKDDVGVQRNMDVATHILKDDVGVQKNMELNPQIPYKHPNIRMIYVHPHPKNMKFIWILMNPHVHGIPTNAPLGMVVTPIW
jgi:hypothetical protein